MHVKSVVSALALSAAMMLSGGAIAQAQTATMMGDVSISAEDLPKVEERCVQLVTASSTESLTTDTDSGADEGTKDGSNDDEANAGSNDATIENVEEVNEIADATATVDLDTITLEQCAAAGLGGAM